MTGTRQKFNTNTLITQINISTKVRVTCGQFNFFLIFLLKASAFLNIYMYNILKKEYKKNHVKYK